MTIQRIAGLLRKNAKRFKYESPSSTLDEFFTRRPNTGLEKGHETFDNVRATLAKIDELYLARSEFQMEFHTHILNGLAPFIYGPAYLPNLKKIKEYNNITKVYRGVLFPAMRQAGKTEAMAMLIVALILNVANINIVVIANSKTVLNKDSGLIARVKKIFRLFGREKFDSDNESHLNIRFDNGDERTLSCYSADKRNS